MKTALLKWLNSPEGRKLLRRALNWPMVWSFAAHRLCSLEHTANEETCDSCAGAKRFKKYAHKGTLNVRRQYICDVCGLPVHQWKRKPRCTGCKPYAPTVERQRGPIVFPLNW